LADIRSEPLICATLSSKKIFGLISPELFKIRIDFPSICHSAVDNEAVVAADRLDIDVFACGNQIGELLSVN
jgi:hypothetical protein